MKTTDSPDIIGAVAVIGAAGRFPAARNIAEFWQNLTEGVEAISTFIDSELEDSGVSPDVFNDPAYVKAKGVLAGVDLFDAHFFGFTPAEASLMDPQQRIFLECAWEACENAGYDFAEHSGRTGVYAGSAMSTYLLFNLLSNPDLFETVSGLQVRIMNDKDFLTTLVSYKLNLKGPSIAVQTACSTSLVAVHLACQGLLDGECDMALAGGVAISIPAKSGYMYTEGGIWSPDGHCRAFDADAQGTVEGNGAGVVVLRRYEDALADGDFIHALIRGSAVNNDGSVKAGYTAPSIESQTQVVAEALAMAGVTADSITYLEAHGSATPLGDPIEVQSLTKAFRSITDKKGFCALGSVKSNVGHLDNAAGIASLIKTVEALKHRVIPATLHFRQPNPTMDLPNSPFHVNTSAIEWVTEGLPRRAGVSSLGIGGTNAHLVLEEAPHTPTREHSRPYQLLPLAAKSEAALDAATRNLANHLKQNPQLNLADVCYTLQVGRRALEHRRIVVSGNLEDAQVTLESCDASRVFSHSGEMSSSDVVMMFPGLGDHHVEMAAELYREEPSFREHFDYCAAGLKATLDLDLREVVYPGGTNPRAKKVDSVPGRPGPNLRKLLAHEGQADEAMGHLRETRIAQPAVFVVEYALAQLLMEWGIHPRAMIGYSIGEYVAACISGVFSIDDALMLVARRAAMIQQIPNGAMLAVPLPEEYLKPLLNSTVSHSAANGRALSIVGGPTDAVKLVEQRLREQGIVSMFLRTSHAFHSQMMDPVVEPFRNFVSGIRLNPPQVPFISNVTGTWITDDQATDPNYWAKHLRHTVRFGEGLQELFQKPKRVLLEVGPGQALSTLARQQSETQAQHMVFASMTDRRDETSDLAFLLNSVGRLWLAGVRVDWRAFNAREHRRRVPLPTYPFERQRYWIAPGKHTIGLARSQAPAEKKPNLKDWFYVPIWKRSRLPSKLNDSANRDNCWLIFLDDIGIGSSMAQRLVELGNQVTCVSIGDDFKRDGDYNFRIAGGKRENYDSLIKELRDRDLLPTHVAHLWGVTRDIPAVTGSQALDSFQDRGFYSLLFLAQALGEHDVSGPLQIGIVTNHLFDVTGDERLCPYKATVLGPAKVIPQEFPKIVCRNIDVVLTAGEPSSESSMTSSAREELVAKRLVDQIIAEVVSDSSDRITAYRGAFRWVKSFEPAPLMPTREVPRALRDGGAYLITGADEEIGLLLAEHLVRSAKAKLALIASPDFPARDKWETWLSAHDDQDEASRKIRRLRALELQVPGNELLVLTADVASKPQMESVVETTLANFGSLNGVIHAANVQGPGIIQLKSQETAASVLAPKIRGTLCLASLLADLPLDFFALFSSTVSIAGGFGQVDSCAANAFLDAFATEQTLKKGGLMVSINWSAFQWNQWQMPEAISAPGLQEQLQQNLKTNGISAGEALQVFEQVIGETLPQVIVCPQDLAAVIEQTDSFTVSSFFEALRESRSDSLHARPAISVDYAPPQNEAQQKIADIWQEAFGIAQLGIHDNFFDLAGNSLLAIQIVTRLRRAFDVELPMTTLFEALTISRLEQKIQEMQLEHSEVNDIERLISEIEVLSVDEVNRKLAEEQ
jgi:acyl transferase domain-containing protein/NAD(P)-dependent dehydrogenase (short-subunit alcohol dehydrogenase family)/acyl carrier protein